MKIAFTDHALLLTFFHKCWLEHKSGTYSLCYHMQWLLMNQQECVGSERIPAGESFPSHGSTRISHYAVVCISRSPFFRHLALVLFDLRSLH